MRNEEIRKDIILALFEAGKNGLSDSGLLLALGCEKRDVKKIRSTLDDMVKFRSLSKNKGRYTLKNYKNYYSQYRRLCDVIRKGDLREYDNIVKDYEYALIQRGLYVRYEMIESMNNSSQSI